MIDLAFLRRLRLPCLMRAIRIPFQVTRISRLVIDVARIKFFVALVAVKLSVSATARKERSWTGSNTELLKRWVELLRKYGCVIAIRNASYRRNTLP